MKRFIRRRKEKLRAAELEGDQLAEDIRRATREAAGAGEIRVKGGIASNPERELDGYCSVMAEVYYDAGGGREAGLGLRQGLNRDGGSHWWLLDQSGDEVRVVDLIAEPGERLAEYENGKAQGLIGGHLSKRAVADERDLERVWACVDRVVGESVCELLERLALEEAADRLESCQPLTAMARLGDCRRALGYARCALVAAAGDALHGRNHHYVASMLINEHLSAVSRALRYVNTTTALGPEAARDSRSLDGALQLAEDASRLGDECARVLASRMATRPCPEWLTTEAPLYRERHQSTLRLLDRLLPGSAAPSHQARRLSDSAGALAPELIPA